MDWLLRWYCGQLSIAERQAYLQWLKTSPEHIAETLRICRHYSWVKTGKLVRAVRACPVDTDTLVRNARAALADRRRRRRHK